ncbi:hypothetical protein RJ640_023756 [Escallonia rubra]|uniref:C2 domain-containing protein n=1 Tax=Escallonia rubra TaxID=112253 RepID=A0AA88UBU0_9ASTE|nr:hypothetical protein RJ640_023756 [Escallonia rubra]
MEEENMVEGRRFHLTLVEARGLEHVGCFEFLKMKVYAKVSISDNPCQVMRTPTNRNGGANPTFTHHMTFPILEESLQSRRTRLHIELHSEGSAWTGGSKYIGEANVWISELFDAENEHDGSETKIVQVRKGAKSSRGELEFSCWFGVKGSFPSSAMYPTKETPGRHSRLAEKAMEGEAEGRPKRQ